MEIELKLFASLRAYLPGKDGAAALQFKVPDDATVASVLDMLKVPKDAAKLIFVNNLKVDRHQRLRDGDRLGVFPPVAGG